MGSVPMDLELFRAAFRDNRVHLALGRITRVEMATDRSTMRVAVSVFPEEREMIAKMTWQSVGPNAGSFHQPMIDDLVMLGQVDGSHDHVYVIARLSSKVDKIPLQVDGNHLVHRALAGKKAYLMSDFKILLGRGAADPAQALVLGNVLMSFLTGITAEVKSALAAIRTGPVGVGNLGAPVITDPALAAALTTIIANLDGLKLEFLTTAATNILSQVSFTER